MLKILSSATETPDNGLKDGLALLESASFSIRTVEEALILSRLGAAMFRDEERIQPGLYALLFNAVEHGLLEIGHDAKSKLIAARTLNAEISRRQTLPENRKKQVTAVIARRADGIYVVITDPGKGFDWKSWTSIDPARASENHGRGIAKARSISFDSLTYNEAGNQVAAFSRDLPDAPW